MAFLEGQTKSKVQVEIAICKVLPINIEMQFAERVANLMVFCVVIGLFLILIYNKVKSKTKTNELLF